MRILIFFVICIIFFLSAGFPISGEEAIINILFTADLHCQVLPVGKDSSQCEGGIVQLGHLIESYRKNYPGIFLLDGGDYAHDLYSWNHDLFKGYPVLEWFNNLTYDVVNIGNHELYYGEKGLDIILSRLRIPVVCANFQTPKKMKVNFSPYVILERAGKRIGIIGLLTPEFFPSRHFLDFRLQDLVTTARFYVDKIRDDCDVIIILGHLRTMEVKRLALEVKGIDLVLSGHEHSGRETPLFYNGVPCFENFLRGKCFWHIQFKIATGIDHLQYKKVEVKNVLSRDEILHFSQNLLAPYLPEVETRKKWSLLGLLALVAGILWALL